MAAQDLVQQLRSFADIDAQRRFLEEHTCCLDDRIAGALKEQADELLRSNIQRSLDTAQLLLDVGEISGNSHHTALGLLAKANAHAIGLGEYDRAVALYEEATEIYRSQGCVLEEAKAQVGKIWPLACLGRCKEAMETGQWASEVLEAHAQWRPLATLTMNMAIVHGRLGEDAEALALFDLASERYRLLGADGEVFQPWIEQNRSIVLRNLGRFADSIQASTSAIQGMEQAGQSVEAARARQNLAVTYFVQGRYNDALDLLDRVRDIYLADGRLRDALLLDLYISDCLLRLGRYRPVLDTCRKLLSRFRELGIQMEFAQALLNQALAHEGLMQHDEALASLDHARQTFLELDNRTAAAEIDVETARVLYRQGNAEASLTLAQSCAELFRARGLPAHEMRASLVAAQAAAMSGRPGLAWKLVEETVEANRERDIPWIAFQCHRLHGSLSREQGDLTDAIAEYDLAASEIERLRSQIMVEFRSGFLEDKEEVYEELVELCLELGRTDEAFAHAERAKSRALVDLLAHRVDLDIQARDPSDRQLVDQLVRLRFERDRLYRRLESGDEGGKDCWEPYDSSERRRLLSLEGEIQDLWHRLLIRNAGYAHDAALQNVHVEPVQPYLEPGDLLVEYFVAHGRLLAFLVTAEEIRVRYLHTSADEILEATQHLWLNLSTVPRSLYRQIDGLTAHAQAMLHRLYVALLRPLEGELSRHQRVIVVPHGHLHYVPFHALYDGTAYVVETHEISYLPSANLLRYCCEPQTSGDGYLIVGHSNGGRLPYAVQEARAVSGILGAQPMLEDGATLEKVQDAVRNCRLLHVAAHGEFRADEPLFSGLVLADGALTTLETFNLRLVASLVTLSACQTGRSVVGGGDELLGLMRAFLYAGASSLVLSLWTVEDRSTARLMECFYAKLAEGWTKAAALRHAQLSFIKDTNEIAEAKYTHPYFWASMLLVGNRGAL